MNYNEKIYKQTLEKLTLNDTEKEKARRLFYESDKKRKTVTFKTVFKPAIAVVCAFAILVTSNALIPNFPNISDFIHTKKVSENSSTLTVYAKELTKNGKVYIEQDDDYGRGGKYWRELKKKKIGYAWDFPVTCKGEQIDTITYTINGSAFFQNTCPKDKSIIKDGVKRELSADFIKQMEQNGFAPHKDRWDLHPAEEECKRYQSITVSYDCQLREDNEIELIDFSDLWNKKKQQQYSEYNTCFSDNPDLWNFMTKDLLITCTITYKDGATEEKQLRIGFDEKVDEDGETFLNRYFYLQ